MNAVELKNVSRRYPGFALEDVSFVLPEGGILGLVGQNGAGKSTLFRLMMNAAARDGGEIRVLGCDIDAPEFPAVRQEIGVVLDEACFPLQLTPAQMEKVFSGIYTAWNGETYAAWLERFAIPPDKPFHTLSRGMRMKLSIAVALSHDARLLLLDEATGGLDVVARDEMLDAFFEFTRDEHRSILISSHIVGDLERLCDYIAFLKEGRLLFCEEKDILLERYGLLSAPMEVLEQLPEGAVEGLEQWPYGARALVLQERVPSNLAVDHATLENIIVFLTRGVQRK